MRRTARTNRREKIPKISPASLQQLFENCKLFQLFHWIERNSSCQNRASEGISHGNLAFYHCLERNLNFFLFHLKQLLRCTQGGWKKYQGSILSSLEFNYIANLLSNSNKSHPNKKRRTFSQSHTTWERKTTNNWIFFRLLCLIPNCSIIITIKTCCNRSSCSTTSHTEPICVRLLCTLETKQEHLLNDKSKEEFNFRVHINYDNGTKDLWNLLFSLIDSAQTEELQFLYFSPSMFRSEIELCTMHKHIIVQMSIHDFSQEWCEDSLEDRKWGYNLHC